MRNQKEGAGENLQTQILTPAEEDYSLLGACSGPTKSNHMEWKSLDCYKAIEHIELLRMIPMQSKRA